MNYNDIEDKEVKPAASPHKRVLTTKTDYILVGSDFSQQE